MKRYKMFVQMALRLGMMICLAVVWSNSWAVNVDRLWLPKSYKALMNQLMYAAQVAESEPGCLEVVSGTINRTESTKSSPVFDIRCRDLDGRTYSVSVTASEHNDKPVKVERSSADVPITYGTKNVEEKKRLEREQAEEAARKAANPEEPGVKPMEEGRAWEFCMKGLEYKTSSMKDKEIDDDPRPIPQILDDGKTIFNIRLDAKSPRGMPLKFIVTCSVLPNGLYLLDFESRDDTPIEGAKSKAQVAKKKPSRAVGQGTKKVVKKPKPQPKTDESGWTVEGDSDEDSDWSVSENTESMINRDFVGATRAKANKGTEQAEKRASKPIKVRKVKITPIPEAVPDAAEEDGWSVEQE